MLVDVVDLVDVDYLYCRVIELSADLATYWDIKVNSKKTNTIQIYTSCEVIQSSRTPSGIRINISKVHMKS